MTRVTVGPNYVSAMGHAGDTIVCAMITCQIVGLVKNLTERIGDDPEFQLYDGVFWMKTDKLSRKGQEVLDAFIYCMRGLSGSYPCNIQFLTEYVPKDELDERKNKQWWSTDEASKKLNFRQQIQ